MPSGDLVPFLTPLGLAHYAKTFEEEEIHSTDLLKSMGEDGKKFLSAGHASYRWRPFAHVTGNGIAGDPTNATVEKGEALLEAGSDAVAALITDAETWAAPQDMRGDALAGVAFRDRK